MTKKFNQYVGKAGHLFVMSEFLMLGWNVAIPEVDIGDDIFVVQDSNGTLRRVQVKTSASTERKSTYSGRFSASVKNLRNVGATFVYYIFIVRRGDEWSKPVIIRQDYLLDHLDRNHVSMDGKDAITLYFSYSDERVLCSGQDYTKYVRDFSDFPPVQH